MSDQNPLSPLIRANEEGHFFEKSQELLAKMRHKLQVEEGAAALASSESAVKDDEVLRELAAVGITPETVRIIHLIPLIKVAWVDGHMHPAEEELIRREAARCGVLDGTPTGDALDELLKAPPSAGLYEAALTYIKALLISLPEDKAAEAKEAVSKMAQTVARVSGGMFNMFFTVEAEEQNVLDEIERRLSERAGADTEAMLKGL